MDSIWKSSEPESFQEPSVPPFKQWVTWWCSAKLCLYNGMILSRLYIVYLYPIHSMYAIYADQLTPLAPPLAVSRQSYGSPKRVAGWVSMNGGWNRTSDFFGLDVASPRDLMMKNPQRSKGIGPHRFRRTCAMEAIRCHMPLR